MDSPAAAATTDNDLACGVCRRPLDDSEDGAVGMLCQDPPVHYVHRTCIEAWRAMPIATLASTCPVCHVNPAHAAWAREAAKCAARVAHERNWLRDAKAALGQTWARAMVLLGVACTVAAPVAFFWLARAAVSSVDPHQMVVLRWR